MNKLSLFSLWFSWMLFVTGVMTFVVKPEYSIPAALFLWAIPFIYLANRKES